MHLYHYICFVGVSTLSDLIILLSTEPLEFVRIFADCFWVFFDADVQLIEKQISVPD